MGKLGFVHPGGRRLLMVFVLANERGRLRGGKQPQRDRWFGLEDRQDFNDFRRWWHREGKDHSGGYDLATRDEALDVYAMWTSTRSNTARD